MTGLPRDRALLSACGQSFRVQPETSWWPEVERRCPGGALGCLSWALVTLIATGQASAGQVGPPRSGLSDLVISREGACA